MLEKEKERRERDLLEHQSAWRPTAIELAVLLSNPWLSYSITSLGNYSIVRRGNTSTCLEFAENDGAAYLTFELMDPGKRTKKWATRDECLRALGLRWSEVG
jgi:hypothetical protein